MRKSILLLTLAAIAHEANRHYCLSIGDTSQPTWDDAPQWQKDSAVAGIEGALAGNTPEQQHQSWCDAKVADGWTYGEVKDPDAKTHPCLVPYAQLPEEQQRKDHLYGAIVRAAHGALTGTAQPEPAPSVSTRAKFVVSASGSTAIAMGPVYDSNPNTENGRFFLATPGGSIAMSGLRPEVGEKFQMGQQFYVDFIPAT